MRYEVEAEPVAYEIRDDRIEPRSEDVKIAVFGEASIWMLALKVEVLGNNLNEMNVLLKKDIRKEWK